MNLLYITSVWNGFSVPNMHIDFINEAARRGHKVTVLALSEKRNNEKTRFYTENGIDILITRCGNIQKTNKYEKVISSLLANGKIVHSAKKYLKSKTIDVVVWSVSTTLLYFGVKKITKMLKSKQYLLLKEYWPQDPVDLGAMKENGLIYKFFKYVEKSMFAFANKIGTSSPAGIDYVTSRYPENLKKCEVCPHCEEPRSIFPDKTSVFAELGLDSQKTTFVYGGNFGISQGPLEIIQSIKSVSDLCNVSFLFLGSGTEYDVVKKELETQKNVFFVPSVDYYDFLKISSCCDCGLIFLYKGYRVPNIPAKFNTYLNSETPVLACIDKTTDLGKIIEINKVGISVFSGDCISFRKAVLRMMKESRYFKKNCKSLLLSQFSPRISVSKIETFAKETN